MNLFGKSFRISLFGESHGEVIGLTADGIPAGIPLAEQDFMADLARRRSGRKGTTSRSEQDLPHLVSGVAEGRTTGAPVTVLFRNEDVRSSDYALFRDTPRPGHADYAAGIKFRSCNDLRGGGPFSGRLTLGLVAAGVIAKKMLEEVSVQAVISALGGIPSTAEGAPGLWDAALDKAAAEGDSLGGIVTCRCSGVPAGWGEPFFDSTESEIAHLVFAIPGIRGIEFGDGFRAAEMKGSEHNDRYLDADGHTARNGAGGINGGITNGNELVFRVAVKPTSSIAKAQETYNFRTGKTERLKIAGRHDTAIALRMPVIVEAAAAIVLADLKLRRL